MIDTVRVPLTKGYESLIDVADAERVLSAGSWCASTNKNSRTVYAVRAGTRRGAAHVRMHSFITGFDYVDHINGDGLDNRRANLRRATHAQNMANCRVSTNNTSGYIGVAWSRGSRKWRAYISPGGSQIHLGVYATAEDAARVRDAASLEHFGPFARLNFPMSYVVGDELLDEIAQAMI